MQRVVTENHDLLLAGMLLPPLHCNCKAGMELEKAANATNKISDGRPCRMLAVEFYVHALGNLVFSSSDGVINLEYQHAK